MRGDATTTQMKADGGVEKQDSLPVRHEHRPDPDNAYRSDGLKAHLTLDVNVPVETTCLDCSRWIRREQRSVTGPGAKWHLKYPNGDPS